MIIGNKDERPFDINVNNIKIENSRKKNLTFKKNISKLCRRALYKLHTLRRINKYLTVEKAKLLANVFINSQFNYAPQVWMFANKSSIDKILKIHKRTFQIVYDVYDQ